MIEPKHLLGVLLAAVCFLGGYILIVSADKKDQQATITEVKPLDLTVTYCESCKRCTDSLDEILTQEFEPHEMESFL